MMSANTVLMKFFKLPPAVRMMLALAGFGSLAAILFTLLPSLRTRQGQIILLIVVVIGVVIFLLFWGLRRLLFRKKSAQLSAALDSQGPTRGDIAEQEQIYREKFRAKLTDLKANGLSTYNLPWFVLVGEPGCGKTASLIHSGLDFPLGKDEVPGFGGTRNYNWWFTNEAVILDTAGRIAFQEEGTTDKVEWEYFLKLLKNHRPRCPVNGVIIALPADKLLRDTSEERAQKAAILRERLRQVHQALGVRFPTFVLVTKMDLVGGFSEFFEEIRVDLQQRNQMCGWSRADEFQEPYDPGTFPAAFDEVYLRLRDWSMRYLQRKATEDELGMIVTFPESFSQLREPLDDYIATIFQKSPLVEPPFFRGFYFTSAVQEGAPIFDVFARAKAGVTVAERPTRAVDSKAFFIHDFYADKVFPEHGLVFRSARHVSLNKRMRRIVWIGSAAMFLLLVTIFAFGVSGVHGLIKAPREACRAASDAIAKDDADYDDLAGNLRLAKNLKEHYEAYGRPWARVSARLLFVGGNIAVPQGHVGRIHARFVLDCVFKPIVRRVAAELQSAEISATTPPQMRERYLAALRVYTKWYGEVVGQHDLAELDGQEAVLRRTEFETLLTFLGLPAADRNDAAEQFELALTTLAADSRSFAREIVRDAVGFDAAGATETIVAAVNRITESWKPLTQLSADNTNPMVKYWADFANRVGDLRERYAEILALTGDFARDDQYAPSVERFMQLTRGVQYLGDPDITPEEPGTLHEAYYNLMTFLENTPVPETGAHRIIRLAELLSIFESRWNTEFEGLQRALEGGAPDHLGAPQAQVYEALARGQTDLATAFQRSLAQIRLRLGLPQDAEPLTYYVEQNLIDIREANPPSPFEGPARAMLARNALGMNERLKRYLIELREMVGGTEQDVQDLEDLQKWPSLLERLSVAAPPGRLLGDWFQKAEGAAGAARADVIRQNSGLKEYPFWKPVDLFGLATQVWSAYRSSSTDLLLTRMAEKAAATMQVDRMPGLARLMPGFDEPATLPFDRHRFNTARAAPVVPEVTEEPQEEEPTGDGLTRLRRSRGPAAPQPGEEQDRLERETSTALLHAYHTRAMLVRALRQFERVQAELRKHSGSGSVQETLGRSADAYVDGYFHDWHDIYRDPTRLLDQQTLVFLEQCGDGALSWPEYVAALSLDENDFGAALADRMEALVREVVMFDYELGDDAIDDAIFDRIGDRLAELNRQRRSVPNLARAMRERRNTPSPSEGAPEVVYARRINAAWRDYVKEVTSLGPLTGERRRSSGKPPDVERLAENIVYEQATTARFPLIAPLMDIAAYGQRLLIHHLDAELAGLFAEQLGRYPLIHPADALDDTALLTRLRDRQTVDPQTFVNLLAQVAEFQDRYGGLYSDVQRDSPALRTLRLCEAWSGFLYDQPEMLRRGEPPRPLDVWLAIIRDPSGTVGNAGKVYSRLTITLPLVSSYGTPAKEIDVATRAGEGIQAGTVQEAIGDALAEYRWDLMAAARVSFDRMTAVVSERHAGAREEYPDRAVGWDLPGDPWCLLMALGARADNDLGDGYWKIPVRMETGVDPIGFLIGLRIGSRERPFPGVISPLEDPGPRPTMAEAAGYLTGPP